MTRNKRIISIALVAVLGAGAAVAASAQGIKSVLGEETPVVWKHYTAVAPTATTKGIKQYWVSCDDHTHVFVKPTGNVEIEEGTWTDALKASVLALNDDRTIAEGDFLTWADSDNRLFTSHFLNNYAYDSTTKTYTARIGENKGTETNPLVNETDAAVHFRGEYLKVARACGNKYISFSLKANSVMPGYTVDRYAIATSGADWRLNYTEKNFDVENFATYELDLSLYDDLDTNEFTVYFGMRNTSAPQFNSIVSDITIKDLAASNFTVVPTEAASNATVTPTANSSGLISELAIHQNGQGTSGGYDFNGLSAGYVSDVHDLGIAKMYVTVKATNIVKFDESKGVLGFLRSNGGMAYPAFIDKWMNFEIDTATTKSLDFGVAHDGGTSNPTADLTVYISYSQLTRNFYNNDNANHCWGIDMSKFTLENAAPGSGGVGACTMTNGASITVNGVAKQGMFYANYLDIANYPDPQEGDIVVFHAGTYQDPTNRWNVNRIGTLSEDLTFECVGGAFIQK